MSRPLLSVVIPTYNRLAFLKKCLESFAAQTFPFDSFEVLVVDDCSPDGTREFLENQSFPFSLRSFFLPRGGAAKARNRGIQEARGEVIVFTDDDCLPAPEFLQQHRRIHAEQNDRIGRGPIVIIREPQELNRQKINISHWSANFFCTSNASIRRENLLRIGNFDESFKRWEDAELGYRLWKAGVKNHFDFQAVVYHWKPPTSMNRRREIAFSDGQGARKFFNRHPSLRTWFSCGLHPLSLFAGFLIRPIVRWKMKGKNPEEITQGIWERLIFHAYFVEGLLERVR